MAQYKQRVHPCDEQNPAYFTEEKVERKIGCQKFTGLSSIGLGHQQ